VAPRQSRQPRNLTVAAAQGISNREQQKDSINWGKPTAFGRGGKGGELEQHAQVARARAGSPRPSSAAALPPAGQQAGSSRAERGVHTHPDMARASLCAAQRVGCAVPEVLGTQRHRLTRGRRQFSRQGAASPSAAARGPAGLGFNRRRTTGLLPAEQANQPQVARIVHPRRLGGGQGVIRAHGVIQCALRRLWAVLAGSNGFLEWQSDGRLRGLHRMPASSPPEAASGDAPCRASTSAHSIHCWIAALIRACAVSRCSSRKIQSVV